MKAVARLWGRMLPETNDTLVRGRAGLVVATCLGLIVAVVALILTWLISGDLEVETVVAGLVFGLVLTGIAALARGGRATAATWLLVSLLLLLVTADAAGYGLGSPAAVSFFVPIVLAACGLGLAAALGVAAYSTVAVWAIALGASSGWYEPEIPFEVWHLTFSAPLLTVLFLLVALIVGAWTRTLISSRA